MRPLTLLLLLSACTAGSPDADDTADTSDTSDTADTSDTSDTADTSDTGTDDDGDGWSVEEGDCDDGDVWVNPGRTEIQDDKDNDCDGWIDERLDAVMVVQVDTAGAIASRVLGVDLLGDVADTWDLASGPAASTRAQWMANDPSGGWWLVDGTEGGIYHLSEAGVATLAWRFEDSTLDPAPEYLYGAAATTDGVFASLGDRLLRVTPAGDEAAVAEWPAFDPDDGHDLFATAVTADPRDGTITLLGFAGGVATWGPDAGYALVKPEDPYAPTASFVDAQADEEGEVYALGDAIVSGSVKRGVFRWDPVAEAFEVAAPWEESGGDPIDFNPSGLAIDTEADEFYVTANGGWFRTVWRLFPDLGYGSLLWPAPADLGQVPPAEDEFRFFTGAAIRWAHD